LEENASAAASAREVEQSSAVGKIILTEKRGLPKASEVVPQRSFGTKKPNRADDGLGI